MPTNQGPGPIRIIDMNNTTTPVANDLTIVETASGTRHAELQNLRNAIMPSQSGYGGKFLTTNGSSMSWGTPGQLPAGLGYMMVMGMNTSGSLGYGGTEYIYQFTPLDGEKDHWKMISNGAQHTVGIRTDGTAWGSGYNLYIGEGANDRYSNGTLEFVKIGNDSDWNFVSAGSQHTFYIKQNGTLWVSGGFTGPYLGLGPVFTMFRGLWQVGTDTDWKEVYAARSFAFSVGIKNDGSLWTWGYANSSFPVLGQPIIQNYDVPTRLGTDTWIDVSPAAGSTIGIKSDGTLWWWGNIELIGGSSYTNIVLSTPTQIGTDNDWISCSAGHFHYMAKKSDGSLWTWGSNDYGQLGDGTTTPSSVPLNAWHGGLTDLYYTATVGILHSCLHYGCGYKSSILIHQSDYRPVDNLMGVTKQLRVSGYPGFANTGFPYKDITNPGHFQGLSYSLFYDNFNRQASDWQFVPKQYSYSIFGTIGSPTQSMMISGAVAGFGGQSYVKTSYNEVVPIAKGGTNADNRATAAANILPEQNNKYGKFLVANANGADWASVIGYSSLGDPLFNNVSIMANFDGVNGSTTFTDYSGNNVLTPSGNVQLSNVQSKFGGTSVYFDGSGSAIYINNTSSINFGFSSFTIEFWLNPSDVSGYKNILSKYASWSYNLEFHMALDGGRIRFRGGRYVNYDLFSTTYLNNSQWYHIAVVFDSVTQTTRLFIDGVIEASVTMGGNMNYPITSAPLIIGYENGGGPYYYGYIDDFRITKGVARYIANFTPPTSSYPTFGLNVPVQQGSILWNNNGVVGDSNNINWDNTNNILSVKGFLEGFRWTMISSNTIANSGRMYSIVGGTGSTITLPTTPIDGDFIRVKHLNSTGSDSIIISDKNINGSATPYTISTHAEVIAIFSAIDDYWIIV